MEPGRVLLTFFLGTQGLLKRLDKGVTNTGLLICMKLMKKEDL